MSHESIGFDLGGTKLGAIRIGAGNSVLDRGRTEAPADGETLLAALVSHARSLWTGDVGSVGVGIAGMVRAADGVFVWGPHVQGLGLPIKATLERELGVPVAVDNDANTAALAETRIGAAAGYRDVLMVTLGTGIGGGLVVGGEIYRGRGFAGEVGHMIVIPDGPICDCGKRGCWETVASGPALARMALEVIARSPRSDFARRFRGYDAPGEAVTRAAESGDETARGLVADVGAAFGRGLVNLIAAFDPEIIVVGGGLGAVGEVLVEPARHIVADRIHGGAFRDPPPIVVATLGADAGAIGAAIMAREAAGRAG